MNYFDTFLDKLHKIADQHDMAELARRSNVTYSWLSKVNGGSIKNPGVRDVEKVNQVIDTLL